jgi:Tfp pilus assembly major pilin PilA
MPRVYYKSAGTFLMETFLILLVIISSLSAVGFPKVHTAELKAQTVEFRM